MRNSTDDKQAGERHVLSKQHVYSVNNKFTGYKQTRRSQTQQEGKPEDTTQEFVQLSERRLTDFLVPHCRPQVSVFI